MLAAGTTLGPYKILAPLGAGGMGEVYRAHDSRLGRDVAIKVLAPHLAAAPEVRARFEREARTISQLNHPHICALYDIGRDGSTDYLVMELLEGETLAHRLEKGPLPVSEVLSLGAQIAEALDRAHRAGVVHRDLKPGNVMLTKSGAKLMDFGLARSVIAPVAAPESPTMSKPITAEGTIVGTFQYMAPEQLEGKEADARSDIWALGCVLYEMATGTHAFEGKSQASLIAAILEHEPRPITELQPLSPPALDHLVRRCLAKDSADRWQNARDVMHELQWVAVAGSQAGVAAPPLKRRGRRAFMAEVVAGVAVATLLVAALFAAGRLTGQASKPPSFTRLTFQRGWTGNARFGPDGKTVVYCAAWDGGHTEIFETPTDGSTTRSLGLPATYLQSISRSGDLAVSRGAVEWRYHAGGLLAVVPVLASAPRDLMMGVSEADWSPDGKTLAVVRRIGGEDRLEMPPGHVLVRTPDQLSDLRVSPDGRHIAFTEHSQLFDTRGRVAMVDATGRKTTLTREFWSVYGLAWSPSGGEIWFSGAESTFYQRLLAVTLKGRCRTVAEIPGELDLKDVAPDGRVLLASRRMGSGIRGRSSADEEERELGWLGFPWARALSADGRMLLLEDQSETGGPSYTTYIRGMNGSLPVRLGQGSARALSPDGRWALTNQLGPLQRLVQIPTGTGDTLSVPRGQVETYQGASWLADGRRIVFVGAEHGHPRRTWIQELPAGQPKPVTPEGTTGATTSPDGRWVAAITPDSMIVLVPVQGGEPRSVAKLAAWEDLCQWSADGRTLFVSRRGVRLDVFRIDVQTGKRQLWRSFELPDPAGAQLSSFLVTPDGRSYAYVYLRTLDELYLVEGLK